MISLFEEILESLESKSTKPKTKDTQVKPKPQRKGKRNMTQEDKTIQQLTTRARTAFAEMCLTPHEARISALTQAAALVENAADALLNANKADVARAVKNGVSDAFLDRLTLTPTRISAMAEGLRDIAALPDPIGVEMARWRRPNGLDIARVSTPLGVLGVIFESRPNVAVDAAGLAIKSANSVILRGGRDSLKSVVMLGELMREGLAQAGLPVDAVQMVNSPDRALVGAMLRAQGGIDVIVPRGGRALVERVQNDAKVPIFAHLEGICHVYIHTEANAEKAIAIAVNAKMRRTGVCGAAETLLIDRALLDGMWKQIAEALHQAGCQIRGDAEAVAACPQINITAAQDDDFGREFLDSIIAVKTVADIDEAIAHIRAYGSAHTEAIISENQQVVEQFTREVDSAIVMVNASTQFADGGEFGLGAELGIATGRIHARGPVGAEQLTCFKYVVRGNGQTRP